MPVLIKNPDQSPTPHHMFVGELSNYYACGVEVDQFMGDDGVERWHWALNDYCDVYWEPIPDYLAEALLRFAKESSKGDTK